MKNELKQLSEIRSILNDINNFTKLEDIEKVLNENPTTANTIKNEKSK